MKTRPCNVYPLTPHFYIVKVGFTGAGAQFEGDLGKILALGAEISPYIDLREKWESP